MFISIGYDVASVSSDGRTYSAGRLNLESTVLNLDYGNSKNTGEYVPSPSRWERLGMRPIHILPPPLIPRRLSVVWFMPEGEIGVSCRGRGA